MNRSLIATKLEIRKRSEIRCTIRNVFALGRSFVYRNKQHHFILERFLIWREKDMIVYRNINGVEFGVNPSKGSGLLLFLTATITGNGLSCLQPSNDSGNPKIFHHILPVFAALNDERRSLHDLKPVNK